MYSLTQNFRLITNEFRSSLVEIASNIWIIEAKEAVSYRPSMQPRYPYINRIGCRYSLSKAYKIK